MFTNNRKEKTTHYRYERGYSCFGEKKSIDLIEFYTIKETEYGFWIKPKRWIDLEEKIFVLKVSKKRYAYQTKEEAYSSFVIRTYKSLGYSEAAVNRAKAFIKLIKEFDETTLKQ